MLKRTAYLDKIDNAYGVTPIVCLLGPRQCGKTTLAKMYLEKIDTFQRHNYFDLEDPNDLMRLSNPKLTLSELEGLIVIDEVQRMPELFPILRVLIDHPPHQQRYLILGSASRELLRQSSETLAGRISYVELTPFVCTEIDDFKKLWLRGGFPISYLAPDLETSNQWRKAYIKTFLEQDIPNLGFRIPAQELRRFWLMLSHYHGNLFNASELGRSLGISSTTIRRYLDILAGTFMVRILVPWFANISKRQVKSPKIYFRDLGIYHTLLNINDFDALHTSPKLASSWEGVALEEVIRFHQADPEDCFFWGIHQQAELDLMILKNGKKLGFEFKYADKPQITASMKKALSILSLDSMIVISPGDHDFPLDAKIRAIGLSAYCCPG